MFFQENTFDNIIYKIVAILFGPHSFQQQPISLWIYELVVNCK